MLAGSCFSLTLPLSTDSQLQAARATAPAPASRWCIALLEDDPDVREAMTALLQRWGHTVLPGVDAQSVLSMAADQGLKVELIVSDYKLGSRNGLEEVAALRQALGAPKRPALLVTGDLDASIAEQAAAAELQLVHKPLKPSRLLEILGTMRTPREARPIQALAPGASSLEQV